VSHHNPVAPQQLMRAHEASNRPLAEHYRHLRKLVSIQASGSPEAILTRSLRALGVFSPG